MNFDTQNVIPFFYGKIALSGYSPSEALQSSAKEDFFVVKIYRIQGLLLTVEKGEALKNLKK